MFNSYVKLPEGTHHFNGGDLATGRDWSFNDLFYPYGDGSKPWYLVNPKLAGKWMFIPLKMYL